MKINKILTFLMLAMSFVAQAASLQKIDLDAIERDASFVSSRPETVKSLLRLPNAHLLNCGFVIPIGAEFDTSTGKLSGPRVDRFKGKPLEKLVFKVLAAFSPTRRSFVVIEKTGSGGFVRHEFTYDDKLNLSHQLL